MKEALVMISFHCLCQGLPHHLRTFRLGPSQTFHQWRVSRGGRGEGESEHCSGKAGGSHITEFQPVEDTCQEHFESRTPIKNSTPI